MEEKKIKQRNFKGTVISNKMTKAIVVEIVKWKMNKKYHKKVKGNKKYLVSDPRQACKVGEVVEFSECRPLSKKIRWQVKYQPVEGKPSQAENNK